VATPEGADITMRERQILGAGLNLAVTEYGDSSQPTVLLVHGFPDTSAVWTPVVQLLAQDFHVVTYDVRGAGKSDVPASRAGYALPLLVADMSAVADATSPDAPLHLVAHDWGSIQAWEAVTSDHLAGRFASYTSMSGPPLDHAALWARSHRRWSASELAMALRQALHSWYIAFFHLPYLPQLMARSSHSQQMWARAMHRLEGVPSDATWPAPTFPRDFAHGVNLYRANVWPRFRNPKARHTDTPVQLIVPLHDRYVTPDLLNGLEQWSSLTWRRTVEAGHWVIRTRSGDVATWVREVISFTEGGGESAELVAGRMA